MGVLMALKNSRSRIQNMLLVLAIAAATLVLPSDGTAAEKNHVVKSRTEYRLPGVPGYITLKCDFHSHTVFSDGVVWPTVRVDEAWREGYDGLAITDHLEYQAHKADIPPNHNRSHQVAAPTGDALDILVVKGSEVTRDMPPGHINAIFLKDSNPLVTKDWHDAVKAAHAQGAFIFWNHPGWERQLVEGKIKWFPEHTRLLQEGMLHGIEIANGRDYYPEAHAWAIEKNLTILGDSDIHAPVGMEYQPSSGDRRPMTLVFAKQRTLSSLKEALQERRTAVIANGMLFGDERYVRPIAESALGLVKASVRIQGKQKAAFQLANRSDLPFELERVEESNALVLPKRIVIPAGKTVLVEVQGKGMLQKDASTKIELLYRANNVLPKPGHPLILRFPVEINPVEGK